MMNGSYILASPLWDLSYGKWADSAFTTLEAWEKITNLVLHVHCLIFNHILNKHRKWTCKVCCCMLPLYFYWSKYACFWVENGAHEFTYVLSLLKTWLNIILCFRMKMCTPFLSQSFLLMPSVLQEPRQLMVRSYLVREDLLWSFQQAEVGQNHPTVGHNDLCWILTRELPIIPVGVGGGHHQKRFRGMCLI